MTTSSTVHQLRPLGYTWMCKFPSVDHDALTGPRAPWSKALRVLGSGWYSSLSTEPRATTTSYLPSLLMSSTTASLMLNSRGNHTRCMSSFHVCAFAVTVATGPREPQKLISSGAPHSIRNNCGNSAEPVSAKPSCSVILSKPVAVCRKIAVGASARAAFTAHKLREANAP